MTVEKTVRLNHLFDFYGSLLTERQRLLFRRYYHEDLSLGEISEEFHITRQAVYDVLRRCEERLEELERSLGLLARHQRQDERLSRVEAALAELREKVDPSVLEPLARAVADCRRELDQAYDSPDREGTVDS